MVIDSVDLVHMKDVAASDSYKEWLCHTQRKIRENKLGDLEILFVNINPLNGNILVTYKIHDAA